MRGSRKKQAQPSKKERARRAHEQAVEKLLAKSRAALAKPARQNGAAAPDAPETLPPLNPLPNLKTEPRAAPVSDSIPAGGGYDKDLFYAYKWKQGKQERTDTILKMEERRKKVRYSFRKEGKMLDFDPLK